MLYQYAKTSSFEDAGCSMVCNCLINVLNKVQINNYISNDNVSLNSKRKIKHSK